MTIKVGVIGATGYVGIEILRLLQNHSGVEVVAISSVSYEDKALSDVYPGVLNIYDKKLTNADEVILKSDVIFVCLPHSLSEEIVAKAKGKLVIDLGADFRLEEEAIYKKWYGCDFKHKDLHNNSIYCIPELHKEVLKGKNIIANPGCYPTSIILGLAPILKNNITFNENIFVSSASGITGAGKKLSDATHFPEASQGFNAYKIANHRHIAEIEQELTKLAGKKVNVNLATHLLPVNRGILSTIFVKVNGKYDKETLLGIYKDFYKNSKFVRIYDDFAKVNINGVKMSNYCDISLTYDDNTNSIVIVSAIDNMVKGAAGQAIQNMNIKLGLKEDEGLTLVPAVF